MWYNDGDTKRFLQAIEKVRVYYKSWNLDLFKDGMSLPELAMRDLFSIKAPFSPYSK